MTKQVFQIARRAFGSYTTVEMVEGYQAASLRAMALEFENADGEYFVYGADEAPGQRASGISQSSLDWL
jgi:hypothetical protein